MYPKQIDNVFECECAFHAARAAPGRRQCLVNETVVRGETVVLEVILDRNRPNPPAVAAEPCRHASVLSRDLIGMEVNSYEQRRRVTEVGKNAGAILT